MQRGIALNAGGAEAKWAERENGAECCRLQAGMREFCGRAPRNIRRPFAWAESKHARKSPAAGMRLAPKAQKKTRHGLVFFYAGNYSRLL